MKTSRTVPLALALLLTAGCANLPEPSATPRASASEFRNLQVLPDDISREELLATMRGFTRGLGVRCNHCHVVTATEPEVQHDFPNDAKETKRVARVMLQMVRQINGTWLERVALVRGDAEAPRVTCWTCHRGQPKPEAPPPPTS
ncbi:MAG: c-type cytochrome [Thermoanaerobaculia bacterium]